MVDGHPPIWGLEAYKGGGIHQKGSLLPPRDQLPDSREALPDPSPTITKVVFYQIFFFQSTPRFLDAPAVYTWNIQQVSRSITFGPLSLVISPWFFTLDVLSLLLNLVFYSSLCLHLPFIISGSLIYTLEFEKILDTSWQFRTMTMSMIKKRLQYCEVRAVLHSCNLWSLSLSPVFLLVSKSFLFCCVFSGVRRGFLRRLCAWFDVWRVWLMRAVMTEAGWSQPVIIAG